MTHLTFHSHAIENKFHNIRWCVQKKRPLTRASNRRKDVERMMEDYRTVKYGDFGQNHIFVGFLSFWITSLI